MKSRVWCLVVSVLTFALFIEGDTYGAGGSGAETAANAIFEQSEDTLFIHGTNGNDQISAMEESGSLLVELIDQEGNSFSSTVPSNYILNINAGRGDDIVSLGDLSYMTFGVEEISTGAGNDQVLVKNIKTNGWVGIINTGAGDDTVELEALSAGLGADEVITGSGSDVVNNNAFVGRVATGSGNDTVNNDYIIDNGLYTGNGDDTIFNNYRMPNADTGGGSDYIENHYDMGFIDTSFGDDTMINYHTLGTISMGNGADSLGNFGNIQEASMGNGNDDLENYGNIMKAYLGYADDSLLNYSTGYIGVADGGKGSDTLINNGQIPTATGF